MKLLRLSKRITALALALAMLTACGSKEASSVSASDSVDSWGGDQWGTVAIAANEKESESSAALEEDDSSGTLTENDTAKVQGLIESDEYGNESGIYSYLQGKKHYEDGLEWSGDWSLIQEEGSEKRFSSFGCGICCLANMYSSLTDDVCTPGEMYEWAKEYSSYVGNGAISWDEIKEVADHFDIGGQLCKSREYSDFQKAVAESRTVMVLVSSYYDTALWTNMPGHYVNIWLYDADTDTVFLTDSGRPANNRQRVALRDIYNALYVDYDYQYMQVK